jgi:hypothetical protein
MHNTKLSAMKAALAILGQRLVVGFEELAAQASALPFRHCFPAGVAAAEAACRGLSDFGRSILPRVEEDVRRGWMLDGHG